jgi:hypothetical protein
MGTLIVEKSRFYSLTCNTVSPNISDLSAEWASHFSAGFPLLPQFFCILAFERIRSGRSVCCLLTKGSGESSLVLCRIPLTSGYVIKG